MQCPSCKSMNADSAKFCSECGATLAAATPSPDAQREVTTAHTSAAMPLGEGPSTPTSAPVINSDVRDDSTWRDSGASSTGAADPSPTVAAPATANDYAREREVLASFGASLMRVITTPIVAVTAIAAALAMVLTFVLSTAAYAAITAIAGGDLPEDAGQWWDFGWVAHYSSMQVPLTADDSASWTGPMLLLATVIVGCCAALFIARAVFAPRIKSDRNPGSLDRFGGLVFAALFLLANLILAAFGPEGTGVQAFMVIVLPLVIAYACYTVVTRMASRRTLATSGTAARIEPSGARGWMRIAATPAIILGMMVAFAAALTLIVNVVQVTTSDQDVDTRAALTWDVTRVIDQGWTTVNYGWLGRSTVSDGDETSSTHVWDLQSDETASIDGSSLGLNVGTLARADLSTAAFVLLLIAAFGTVVLGGIYAGFRTAHRASAGTSTSSALMSGALTGPVWFVMSIIASLVVTDRAHFDSGAFEGGFSMAAGLDGAFLALAAGTILGAVGGLLAAHAASSIATPTTTRSSNDLPSSGAMPSA